jgi:hypothetical protein
MTDHGMLFTDALARSILQGRKVVTRRPITRQTCLPVVFASSSTLPSWTSRSGVEGLAGFGDLDWSAHTPDVDCSELCETRDYCSIFADGSATKGGQYLHVPALDHETRHRVYCRIVPGDRLWVREAWRVIPDCTSPGEAMVVYRVGASSRLCNLPEDVGAAELSKWSRLNKKGLPRWTPSLLMPRWAARTVREVVSVHAEQLGPLTPEQALEEGFGSPTEFQNAWDAIYRDAGKTMASRPWVWVTRFAGPVE